ncbi:putative ATPase [Thermobacillus composti KWC4]|uniref:Putative ATPase n=1 Tax=Thermobacillus composti (strain DSM 18247 / JCM 13945 / KWC4) TaxID=717605 RepID=L0EHV2_THECK|nr:AAA family ATPase [Thermobacillus composti]AGA59362.1 putative ATPase [Thermobacillus composti KWC4]
MFLRSVTLLRGAGTDFDRYPFAIPAIRSLDTLPFTAPVTFFVGENGSGKSTLLEAIAWQCGFNTAGGGRNHTHEVEASDAPLGPHIRLSWLPKVTSGFFLRAESFYHFASYLDRLASEDPPFNYGGYGGRSLHEQSHGESFLSLFLNRFGSRTRSLYLLDEPEAALSPARQLAFLRILHQHAASGRAQFIIATHSPILLGFPGAVIYSFDGGEIRKVGYEETEHYQITKGFLNRPELYLQELFRPEEGEED